jgi:alpha-L-arabinofuranosidase
VEGDDAASAQFSVSASRQARDVASSLVNASADEDLQIDCSLASERPASASAQILHSDDLNAYNDFDGPEAIAPRSHPTRVEGNGIQLDVPRLSVVTVTVRLA